MSRFRSCLRWRERIIMAGAYVLSVVAAAAFAGVADTSELPGIEVIKKQIGTTTLFSLRNPQLAELTVSLRFTLANLTPTAQLPIEVVVPPNTTTAPLVALFPADPSRAWRYTWEEHFTWGSPRGHADANFNYRLPFEASRSFKVIQGHDGAFSHSGELRNAIDFQMPEGTPVLAARDGLVVMERDGFETGCDKKEYLLRANEIFVRHEDGTIGEYVHLLKGGMRVKVGDRVAAGQVLGLSGNSGYTRGPHLHFMVFRAKDSRLRESLSCRFVTSEGIVDLEEGRAYMAPALITGTTENRGVK